MSFPRLVTQETIDRIKAEEQAHQERLEDMAYKPRFNRVEVQQACERKERFLELLSQCLSPKLACKQLGINTTTYRKWRTSDSWFCEELNHIIQDWKGELLTSSIGRAVGYVRNDKETGEIETDAQGKVIRYGASDRLAITLLNADRKEQELNQVVNISLNFSALGVEKAPPEVEHLASNVIEGEVVEQVPDADPVEVSDE